MRYRLAFLLLLLSSSARPQWTVPQAPPAPPSSPLPGTRPPTTAEGGFSQPDRTAFDERHRGGVMEQLCQRLHGSYNLRVGGPYFGVGLNPSRRLETYPDRTLALVDAINLSAYFNYALSRPVVENASFGFHVGASISGMSETVRPLASKASCAQLKRVADVRDFKLAVPFSAERIQAMELGELWNLPFTLTVSRGVSAGAQAERGGVGISIGQSEAGSASLTLYRLAEDKVRFKFRANYVKVKSQSASVAAVIPALEFASNVENFLVDFAEREINKQVNRYMKLVLSGSRSDAKGKQLILEFTVDPRDPAQAEALAKALMGNFIELVAMSAKIGTLQVDEELLSEFYDKRRAENARVLGAAQYAAVDEHASRARGWQLNLLMFAQINGSRLSCENKVTRIDGDYGRFLYHCADKSFSGQYFGVPGLGYIVKESAQRRADTVSHAPRGEGFDEPRLVYLYNQGFSRVPAPHTEQAVDRLNSILRLAGAQRGAEPGAIALDKSAIVPPPPPPASKEQDSLPSDRKGHVSLSLVFNQRAVREAAEAGREPILQAYRSVLYGPEQPLLDWLVQNGRLEKGRIVYDESAARRALGHLAIGERDIHGELLSLSREAAKVLSDFASLREAPSNEERASRLRDLFAGDGRSQLEHENFMKVLIQLVDPMDITGDLVSSIRGTTTDRAKVTKDAHLVLKEGRVEVPQLQEAGQVRGRFARPSRLLD